MQVKKTHILSFARKFFGGTLFSRFSGFIREAMMAFFFGSNLFLSQFLVAFRLSNLFRRLFGEGALLYGFIPQFEKASFLGTREAHLFFRDAVFSVAFFLTCFITCIELLLYFLSSYFLSSSLQFIFYMIMIMLPGLFFICMYSLFCAYLESHGSFFLPAFAPALFNVTWISCVIFFHTYVETSFFILLSLATVVGFALQWLLTFLVARRHFKGVLSFREWMSPKLFSPGVIAMSASVIFSMIGVAAGQVNSAFDVIFAYFCSTGGPVFLSFSHRVFQLPIGLFGVAISSALMPTLTKAIESKSEDIALTFRYVFSRSIALICFVCALMSSLAPYGLNLIYGRGHFLYEDVVQTTYCFWGYSLGMVFSCLSMILASTAYSFHDYRMPVFSSLLSVVVNITLNVIFIMVFNFPVYWIAIATSLASITQFFFLVYFVLIKRFQGTVFKGYRHALLGIFSMLGYLGCRFFLPLYDYFELERGFFSCMQRLCIETTIFLFFYLLLSFAFSAKELFDWFRRFEPVVDKNVEKS